MKEKDNKEQSFLTLVKKSDLINYLHSKHNISPKQLFDLKQTPRRFRYEIINQTFQHFAKTSFIAGRFTTEYKIPGVKKSFKVGFSKVKNYKAITSLDKLRENINRTREHREHMKVRAMEINHKKKEERSISK